MHSQVYTGSYGYTLQTAWDVADSRAIVLYGWDTGMDMDGYGVMILRD